MAAKKFTEEDGHQLAADMLRAVQDYWYDVGDDEGDKYDWRKERSEILRRYLRTLAEHTDTPLEAGFLAVITDYIGCCTNGAVPDPEFYEEARQP